MFRNTVLTLAIFLTLSIVPNLSSAQEAPASDDQTIRLGYVDFPPYEFEENGQPEGILVNVVKEIFQRAEVPFELQLYPFKRAYNSTKTGEIDGLFNFYKTDGRMEFFDYTEPVIINPLVLFVRKDSALKYEKLEDLKGLTIGTMHGYSYGEEFDESTLFFKDSTTTHASNFKKLALGRIDAYPCDKLVGLHLAMEGGYMSELKVLPNPVKVMDGHIGFTKGKHWETIGKLNATIKDMQEKGEIQKMINQYIEENL